MGRTTKDFLVFWTTRQGIQLSEPCRSLGNKVIEKVHDGGRPQILDQRTHGTQDPYLEG